MVCGGWSSVAHGRALGIVAERFGMGVSCGPGAGIARGWDREWRWTVLHVPDKVGEASAASRSLAPMGWKVCSRHAHH